MTQDKGSDGMTAKDQRFCERWQTQRAAGRRRFVLLTGMLAWGVPMFVVMTFFAKGPAVPRPGFIAVSAVIWLAAGALFGFSVWTVSERKYRKLSSRLAPKPSTDGRDSRIA
jgi:hypothetical protein